MRKYLHFIFAFLLIVSGTFGIGLIRSSQKQSLRENEQLELINAHDRVISIISNSIEKLAAVVSGLQAYTKFSDKFPSAENLQSFLNVQLKGLNYSGPVVVSFLDTTHTFQYSFSRSYIDPGILKGTQLNAIRDSSELRRLERLMLDDSIKLFYPLNLVEGWLGIPIDVRVHRDNSTLGYLATIFDFKSVIQPIYEDPLLSNYIFRFSTDMGDFDREVFHDGSPIYNQSRDQEYFKNFDVGSEKFHSSSIKLYGREFQISTASKGIKNEADLLDAVLMGGLIIFWILVVLIAWQIDRYKRLTAKLSGLNKTKDKFFSIIAHDLKGPLNSLLSFAGLLINHFESLTAEEIQKLARDLDKSLKNLFALLENLLQWARSQTGNIDFVQEEIELVELLTENKELLEKQAEQKGINIEVVPSDQIYVNADYNSISTVVRNLLSNAIKYTRTGGLIKLEVKSERKRMIVSVSDDGVGMSKETIVSLFELDTRQSTKGTQEETGTGLGLTLCKEFVEKNGGKIWAESKVGSGSSFYFSVPK